MDVFRISKTKYANDLSGFGAEKFGGRWNSKGNAVLYTSSSRALALTEILVHIPVHFLQNDFSVIHLELPKSALVKEFKLSDLPSNWKQIPASQSTQIIGDYFIEENNFLALKVPSVVVEQEFNYLINPHHKDFKKVKIKSIEAFSFDERFF